MATRQAPTTHAGEVPLLMNSSRLLRRHPTLRRTRWAVGFGFVLTLGSAVRGDDLAGRGGAIYRDKCASCHGAAGEGSRAYAKSLVGEKSVGQLAQVVAATMPEDDPGTCTGEDARAVAAYVHEAFYSVTARERNRPARVELSRLTVRQLRNTLADLVGESRSRVGWPGGSGLQGQYYKSRNAGGKQNLVFERVDPEVRFDFGVDAPRAEGFDKAQFSITWRGSLLAPDTGEYEFVVRSDQAIRLFVNDSDHALIDAAVASADHDEQRASVFLLGGRAYPVRLEFSKAKQGVDDSKDGKKKIPEKRSSIALAWKPPGGVERPIPARAMAPQSCAASFVPTTPFPPDDRSVGYERGSTVSKAWDAAVTDAAIETTAYVAAHLNELAGAKDDDPARPDKIRAFSRRFAEGAFRRPLDAEQAARYLDRPFASTKEAEVAARRSVLAVIKSPYFLYREVECRDPMDVAARLAYQLWDAPPDAKLIEAARRGQLATREQVKEQAWRMLDDVRAHAKVREFFLQWLRVEQALDLAKDAAAFPGFDPELVADLRASLEWTLDDLLWGPEPDFRRLLDGDSVYLNGRLASFYGVDLAADAPFQKVAFEATDRSGVLTHPYLLANFAYTGSSSPIHRGVFLMRSVLGRTLRPPPEAIAPLAPDLHAGLSTRERVALQTSPKSCVNCHAMINPLGFGLEGFDAVGRLRREEKGRAVDLSGVFESADGGSQPFRGAKELGSILAASPEAHAAFVTQLFHHQVKQPIRAFGPTTRADLTAAFAAHDFNIRHLLVEVAATAADPTRRPQPRKPADLAVELPANPFASEPQP